MARLSGKVAIITAAAQGMGAEHARVFVEEGAKVVLTDVNEQEGGRVAAGLGPNAVFLRHDVTDPDAWAAVVEQATATFGPSPYW